MYDPAKSNPSTSSSHSFESNGSDNRRQRENCKKLFFIFLCPSSYCFNLTSRGSSIVAEADRSRILYFVALSAERSDNKPFYIESNMCPSFFLNARASITTASRQLLSRPPKNRLPETMAHPSFLEALSESLNRDLHGDKQLLTRRLATGRVEKVTRQGREPSPASIACVAHFKAHQIYTTSIIPCCCC